MQDTISVNGAGLKLAEYIHAAATYHGTWNLELVMKHLEWNLEYLSSFPTPTVRIQGHMHASENS